MTKKVVTNDGKKGGWLVGKRHYDKQGKSLGGIKAVVTDAGDKPVELEGGEVIINREASKKYWKELSKINQSAGNGVPIEPPTDAFDEDPAEDYENGGKIEFNANHIPNKWILNYAIKLKEEHPDVWALGGNIFGNQAFVNLKRVAERGHWLDSEEWMYKKWRAFVARHKGDFRIQGVIAMLKWVDKVDKGWQYMKNLIEEEIKKREARKSKKMNDGGNVSKQPKSSNPKQYKDLSKIPNFKKIYQGAEFYSLSDNKPKQMAADKWFELFRLNQKERMLTSKEYSEFLKLSNDLIWEEFNDGGNLSKTPAPAAERIKGSKTNPKGTAKDSKSGASIKFDDNTLASIQSLIDAHNEKYPSKEITLGVAKAVVRRGMGAYSGTHRPTITGGKPNSRTAWGLARLKAFIYKAEKGNSKSGKYSQDNDLFDDLDIEVSKFATGGGIETAIGLKNPYNDNAVFFETTAKENISTIFENVSFKKFGNEFRKHIDPYFKQEYNTDRVNSKFGMSWKELASYIIGDGTYSLDETKYNNFIKAFDTTYVKKFDKGGEIEKGIKAEYEHAKTIAKFKREGVSVRDVARSIAEDHLKEDPHYYSKLAKMEGKKFATGGLVTDAGGTANVGDKGVLETRNGRIDILITGITDKKVRFKIVSDNNRPDSNPVERFVRNYRGASTATPAPTPQSTVAHELNNYRIKTEREFINEYGTNWTRKVGWLSNSSNMDWLFGEKITDIVTPDMYDNILEAVKNKNNFTQNVTTKNVDNIKWSINNKMYMFDPALYSQNVATNLGQTKQKDTTSSRDETAVDAKFEIGDTVYIRKDIADYLDVDFDSNDNVFRIVSKEIIDSDKNYYNPSGAIYKIEQIKNIANKRIFKLPGNSLVLLVSGQTKPQEFGNYILKKNVTKEDFENIKIIVDTPEKSEAFQKLMFSLDIDWLGGGNKVKHLDKDRMTVRNPPSNEYVISYILKADYKRSPLKEIQFDDLFELKGQSKPVLSEESLQELFKDVKAIDKEREALEATPQKNETQINDELKALEDEYNDLLFLIDITPSTDVDNMLSLKLQAKQLKDKIDLLHLDLKKKVDGELQLLDNLFNASAVQPQERYKFNPYNDGFAPDGQPTSLPKNLYDWTMTQEFQNWFGNFTNAYNYRNSSYENVPCSVVVNKHYEPLVVYHGTGVEFSFFKFDKFPAMYFAENEAYSNWFAEMKGQQSGTNGYVYPFFLNIRTPLDLTIYGIEPVAPDDFIDWMFLQTGLDAEELKISKALLDPSQKFQAWMYLRNSPEMLNVLRDKAICDGIIYYEDNPSVDKSSDAYQTKAYIVFNSNSAKIADPNREMMTIPAMRSFYLKRGGKL